MEGIVKSEISVNDSEKFYDVWEMFNYSFPVEERRSLTNIRYVLSQPHCRLLTYSRMNKVLGFILYWEYPQFIYMEYFAVNRDQRNGGIGAYIIADFIESFKDKPLILEIDEIKDDISHRRCGFYKRNGFVLNEHLTHTPTAYNSNEIHLNMHIMTSLKPITVELYNYFNEILIDDIMVNLYDPKTK